jgi:peroxiredoxin
MLKKQFAFSLVLAASLLFACRPGGNKNFQVNLSYTHADKLGQTDAGFTGGAPSWVYLEEIVYGKTQAPVVIDSARLKGAEGQVELKGKGSGKEGIYELVFGDNLLGIPLINDAARVQVQADLSGGKDFYSVTGSAASRQLQDLLRTVSAKNREIEKAFTALDSLNQANAADSLLLPATAAKDKAIRGLNDYLKQFISSTPNGTLGFLALSWASRSLSPEEMDTAMKQLNDRFPGNSFMAQMQQNAEQQSAQTSSASWVGKTVPELILPDVSGKPVSVSSFKGKYLLIDFWASWCGPCRMENPNVVAAYNEFKGKNFAILGVSLDKDRDAWEKAIAQDHLTWTHISDLKYWGSEAVQIFGIEGIPFNVLVDPSGKIIAQELRGPALEAKLKEVLP